MTHSSPPTPEHLARRLADRKPALVKPYIPSDELSPRAHRATLKGTAIGRRIVGGRIELPQEVRRTLQRERAVMHTERSALMYIGFQAMGYYAGKNIMGSEHVHAALSRLAPSGRNALHVQRNKLGLSALNNIGDRVASFSVYATVANVDSGGQPSRIDVFEKRKLHEEFNIESNVARPQMWIGYLNLPAGSGVAEELVEMLDETIPDQMTVGHLELIGERNSTGSGR